MKKNELMQPNFQKTLVMKYGINYFYCYYIYPQDSNKRLITLPDGCVDILFFCSDQKPSVYVMGSPFEPLMIDFLQPGYYFGVRFLPGFNPFFHKMSMSEVQTEPIALKEFYENTDFIKRIVENHDYEYQKKMFLNDYIKQYITCVLDTTVSKNELRNFLISKIIYKSGSVTINELAQETFFSKQYIERIFKNQCGMNLKSFSKLVRFQNLLHLLNQNSYENLAVLSQKVGYYDQSHMIKEFKKLSGVTPKQYLEGWKEKKYDMRVIEIEDFK